jgi:hypothetical protein
MRAILLENDILMAEAFDVKWSVTESDFYSSIPMPGSSIRNRSLRGLPKIEFGFKCEYHFLKNFIDEDKFQRRLVKKTYLLIFENLSWKTLYGVCPLNIVMGEHRSEIDFIVEHYNQDFGNENVEYIKSLWLKNNRDRRIDEILG